MEMQPEEKEGTALSMDDRIGTTQSSNAVTDFLLAQVSEQPQKDELATKMANAYDFLRGDEGWESSSPEAKKIKLGAVFLRAIGETPGINFEAIADAVIDKFEKHREADSRSVRRLVDVGFEIKRRMSYNIDLGDLIGKVEELFDWHSDHAIQEKHFAPYFPIIQSSGMGKTKLMYETREYYKSSDSSTTTCFLLLCRSDGDTYHAPEAPDGFDGVFAVPSADGEHDREKIRAMLTQLLGDRNSGRFVFMFDESQNLLDHNNAFAFRVIRWWLKEKRGNVQCVALFAGTTSKIAHFYKEPQRSTVSRNNMGPTHLGPTTVFGLIPPFYQITTIGLERGGIGQDSNKSNSNLTEYDLAVKYGRPLFELIRRREGGRITLEHEETIMQRMLISESLTHPAARFSVLATRVQMGQVPFALASELVSKGYGSLTYFSETASFRVAEICFFPDPVLARLAMLLMVRHDETGGNDLTEKGRSPVEWSKWAAEIFSHGLCRPQKGDVGEIAAAMYMLFCGDVLRQKEDPTLRTFSVSLSQWLLKMMQSTRTSLHVGDKTLTTMVTRSAASKTNRTSSQWWESASVSFIQVCRDYLRFSRSSIEGLMRTWYASGRAIYVYPCCPAIDIIAPIRFANPEGADGFGYAPLVVSVKNRLKFTNSERVGALESMRDFVRNLGCTKGLCILLLLGLASKDDQETAAEVDVSTTDGDLLSCVITVPEGDEGFGVSDVVETTIGGGEKAEVYVSHAEIASRAIGEVALRAKGTAEVRTSYNMMWDAMNKSDAAAMDIDA